MRIRIWNLHLTKHAAGGADANKMRGTLEISRRTGDLIHRRPREEHLDRYGAPGGSAAKQGTDTLTMPALEPRTWRQDRKPGRPDVPTCRRGGNFQTR